MQNRSGSPLIVQPTVVTEESGSHEHHDPPHPTGPARAPVAPRHDPPRPPRAAPPALRRHATHDLHPDGPRAARRRAAAPPLPARRTLRPQMSTSTTPAAVTAAPHAFSTAPTTTPPDGGTRRSAI